MWNEQIIMMLLEEHSFTEQLDAEESAEFTKQLNEFEKIYQI